VTGHGFPLLGRLPIMPAKCGSCLWRTDGRAIELRPGRREEIEAYLREGTTHQCHSVGPLGPTGRGRQHTCAGSVEYMASVGIHDEQDRVLAILRSLGVEVRPLEAS